MDFKNWTATELFDYLQSNEVIDEDDQFEDWMNDRVDMIDMAEEYHEENQ